MSDQPSVGIVCHFHSPPGGMPVQAEALAKGLESEGFRVIRITTDLGCSATGRWLDSLRFVRTFCRVPIFFVRLLATLPFVRNLHVLSCSGLSFFLFTAPAVCFGSLCGIRVILHYHGGDARVFFERWPRLIRSIAHRADHILVPSGFLQKVFQDLGCSATPVPNICDPTRFSRTDANGRGARFVVARCLEPVYNIGCILKAFRLVLDVRPDAELWILGSGSEQARLKESARDSSIAGAVRFLGAIDNANLPDIYRCVSIFVNASLVDNQPVSILEAFAAGLPVITSRAGGIPDLVENGRTGIFFDPHDPEDLAAKMLLLLRQPALARELAKRGQEKAAQFSWPAVFRRLEPVYTVRPRSYVSSRDAC